MNPTIDMLAANVFLVNNWINQQAIEFIFVSVPGYRLTFLLNLQKSRKNNQ
jgi:hypothetical protein